MFSKESKHMSDAPTPSSETQQASQTQGALIGAVIGILVVTIALVVGAVLLAANADRTGPAVEVVRDLLITTLAVELAVIGVAVVVFIVQVARFVNLVNNEVKPIVTTTTDTLNTVRGTAVFLSKNLTEPVISASAALRGVYKVVKDADAIRHAAGIAAATASRTSPTGASTAPAAERDGNEGRTALDNEGEGGSDWLLDGDRSLELP
jgi:hypothetical protein